MRRLAPRPIGAALERVASGAAPATPLARVQRVWAEAAGELVAGQSEPVAEREGILTVACRSATWTHELALMAEELAARLNDALAAVGDPRSVGAIRFVTRSTVAGP